MVVGAEGIDIPGLGGMQATSHITPIEPVLLWYIIFLRNQRKAHIELLETLGSL